MEMFDLCKKQREWKYSHQNAPEVSFRKSIGSGYLDTL
jgi:hypothetical protein